MLFDRPAVEKLDACFVVRDTDGPYGYFEDELGRGSVAKLLSKDEARRLVPISVYLLSVGF